MRDRDELVLDAVAGRRASAKGWVRARCPFCPVVLGTEDRHLSLGLGLERGAWRCYRCGSEGLLELIPDVDELAIRRPAARRGGAAVPAMTLPEGFLPLYGPGTEGWWLDGARGYLARRGLSSATARAAGVGAVLSGRHRGRVVVPVAGRRGDLAGWSARLYVDRPGPKYIYPEGMRRGELLYNQLALGERGGPVFVTEGVFDALALWPDAVACLGKPSEAQRLLLLGAERPVVTLLDGDAWRESEALALWLRVMGREAGSVRLGARVDPATADPARVRAAGAASLAARGAQVSA